MASVRITQELKKDISNRAAEAFNLADPTPQMSNEDVEILLNGIRESALYKEMKAAGETYNNIFAKYARERDMSLECQKLEMGVQDTTELVIHGANAENPREAVVIPLQTPRKLYTHTGYWNRNQLKFNTLDIDRLDAIEKVKNYYEKSKERTQRYFDYNIKIRSLLENCTTLKQLLEVWPAAEAFVPSHLMQKLNEKVTRKQRAAQIREQVEFDASEINQIVLTAKLVGQ